MLNKKILTIIIGALAVILLHYAGALRLIENYVISFFEPIARVAFNSGNAINTAYEDNIDERDLKEATKRLEKENKELLAENIKLRILEDENKALREQLNFYSRHDYRQVSANIISRESGAGAQQVIAIDRGSIDGIKTGQAVVSIQGIAVGKIFLVKEEMSYAHLTTDESCQLAVTIAEKKETNGIVKGNLGLTIKMDFIPQTEDIKENDLIITSGLEQLIPRGLIIGKIQKINKESNDLFQSAVISPAVNLNTLSIVSVIIN